MFQFKSCFFEILAFETLRTQNTAVTRNNLISYFSLLIDNKFRR